MFRRKCLFLMMALGLAACGTQPSRQQASAAPAQAPGSSQANSSSILRQGGCSVDLKKVCQAFIDQPEFVLNGERFSWERFANSSPPHTEIELPASVLGNSAEGTARCQVTIHTRKVTDARLLSGGPSIDKTMEYFKHNGWCAEASPNYDKLIADLIQRLGNSL